MCFNTASGMAQLQLVAGDGAGEVSAFQYRKRYGPVATYGFCCSKNYGPGFQYRKRYGPVATASLESRSRTGLKWQIGKPPRFFPLLPAVSVNTSSFFTTFIRFYTSIYADFRIHKKSGKPHFRLSFIIAGFSTFCQISNHFPKIKPFLFRKALNTGSEAI